MMTAWWFMKEDLINEPTSVPILCSQHPDETDAQFYDRVRSYLKETPDDTLGVFIDSGHFMLKNRCDRCGKANGCACPAGAW